MSSKEKVVSEGFRQKREDIITMNNCRILRPYENKMIVDAIPKIHYKDMYNALLYSGARYVELQRLFKHPEWFTGTHIHLTKDAIKKKKATISERYIHLNQPGKDAVLHFIHGNHNLPSYATWRENLKRWARDAGLYGDGMSPKTTRKTYESWLVWYYPEKIATIFGSQGHNELTALRHYVNLPFTEQDKNDMRQYVEGWQ